MFYGGVQIREEGSKSASGYGPGGSKSASGFGPGGPNPRGVQIRCDTGLTKLPFRGERFGSCALKVYEHRSTHGRKKQTNYMKLSENL